jgi:adenosylmethionine-8-amino-7-oxononanoate aminotransferase
MSTHKPSDGHDARSHQTALWHPFANMGQVRDHEIVIVRGEGSHVFDQQGRRYVDATASLWYANVGYGRSEIADAVAEQMRTLHAYTVFGAYANPRALELAERLAGLVPLPDPKIFLTSGGSDSVDTAAKLVRRYWAAEGTPERTVLISRERSYHGMHGFGTGLAGIPANTEGFGPAVPDVCVIPHDDAGALEAAIASIGSDRTAAFFVEPVIGAGGVIPPSSGYLEACERICRSHDVLFVVDEVVTGFGRLGAWFGSDRYGITPDLLIGAKGLTSGYVPLGMVAVAGRVAAPFWDRETNLWFRHGYTYSGHAAGCAAAIANLDVIDREGLIERVASLEPVLADAVQALRGHPAVSDVRHAGLLAAVEFEPELVAENPNVPALAVAAAREAGVLTRAIVGPGLQISPPFVIDEAGIAEIVSAYRHALDAVL